MNVSAEFKANFDKVCEHYECAPDEIAEMKGAVRRDYEGAKICFAAIAKEIDEGSNVPAI